MMSLQDFFQSSHSQGISFSISGPIWFTLTLWSFIMVIRVVHSSHFWAIFGTFTFLASFLDHFWVFGRRMIRMDRKMMWKMKQKMATVNTLKCKHPENEVKMHFTYLWQCLAHSNSTSKDLVILLLQVHHQNMYLVTHSCHVLSTLHSPHILARIHLEFPDSECHFFWYIYHCERVIPGQSNLLFLPGFPGIYPNFEQPN